MRVLNFGSINIDHVYRVVALARAGAPVWHAGKIGADGLWLKNQLGQVGVDTTFLEVVDGPTGHAIIQVIPSGENAIVLHGGANQHIELPHIAKTLSAFSSGDYLLVQNEISGVAEVIRHAAERGLKVAFNPAPLSATVRSYPLDLVDIFFLNQVEAEGLTQETTPENIAAVMRRAFPKATTILTLGSKGACYFDAENRLDQSAEIVAPVDTTAAGDTFIGFLLAELSQGGDKQKALALACRAAAICVTRPGAADSIPWRSELESPLR
jgi:ribokinase